MKKAFSVLALALLVCAVAPAAAISTTLTVNATVTASSDFSSFVLNGTTNFTAGIGSGTIKSTISLASLSGTSAVADYTITLAAGGTLTGKISVPVSVLTGGATPSATVAVTVTGGTGTYSGATAPSFNLTGSVSGSLLTGFTLTSFTGAGTITTGGTVGPPVPTIAAVLDSAGYTANIAPGSIFALFGSNVGPATPISFALPRPTSSGGVKITFTPVAGGTGTDAYLLYLTANQLGGILPSTVAVGNYNVTVTNGTVSAPFAAQVVANKIALFTQNQQGNGLAAVQNFISQTVVDLNRLTTGVISGTTVSPAHPGQFMQAYGTGLGGYTAGDNSAADAFFDFSTHGLNIQAVVGGVSIPVLYAGRAGYPGEDQINFQLPANVPTGCAVTLQFSVNGKLSVPTSISIAPDANSNACVLPGFTADQLKKLDGGGTYTVGAFTLTSFSLTDPAFGTFKAESAAGAFTQIDAFQLSSASGQTQGVATDTCIVSTSSSSGGTSTGTSVGLDAGAVTLNGPAGSNITNLALKQDATTNSYSATLGSLPIPGAPAGGTLVAGTYALKGAGGKGVKAFNASVTLGSPLTVTSNLAATVVRSSGLTVNWTGGNASDLVQIFGSSGGTSGTTSFVCTTTAGKLTFTVPASILTQLPATSGTNAGLLAVTSAGNPATGNGLFSADLTAGGSIDAGVFLGFVGSGASPIYQ